MWKKRLENQIQDLCKDLDRMIELSKGNKLKKKHSDQLRKFLYIQWKKLDNELNQKEESLKDATTE